MDRPDPDILKRAQEGDRDALDVLLRPELDRVYATCRRMVSSRDEAEELSQDALVKIIRGLPTYDGRASLSTWMTRVTINACLSWLRARTRRARRAGGDGGVGPISLDTPDAIAAEPGRGSEPGAAGGVQPDDAAASARVVRALDALRPEYRAVLVLRDVRGLDYAAIGSALDLPVGTVKSRLFRARSALRAALEDEQRAAAHRADDGEATGG